MTEAMSFCNKCGGQNVPGAPFCGHCGAVHGSPASTVIPSGLVSQITLSPSDIERDPHAASASYGGFWIRFVAALIDGILVQAIVVPVAMLLSFLVGLSAGAMRLHGGGAFFGFVPLSILWTFGLLVSWIYEAGMESSSRQATLGKMALGLKVSDLKGNRISFARASGRHFAKIVSGMILLIGYIMAGFTNRKQALHDMIAETLVLRVRS